ncbi:hypothetical protein CERSUDRAFT_88470 [Gelatoporia subvermispora B]|uniref:Cytochrome P450 n=1 Tax=Ceriporiopsis subvermispora (strain B) TaxID=914234 RepID=M2R0W0_CERS8|nr:hypothetical protein CERSUDRAFT_88470 [Gelatoporia subvermispora B]
MPLPPSSPSLLLSILVCSISWLLWRVLRQLFVKSPLDDLPGPPVKSHWKGNIPQIYDRQGWKFYEDITQKYGPIVKLKGLLGGNILYVFDPVALHTIVVKDQDIFEEASYFIKSNLQLLGPGLLSTLGDHHRKQRKLLNPVFSNAHMRRLAPVFYRIMHQLESAIKTRVVQGPREIDVLSWMGRAALELIGQGGLGYSFDPLAKDASDPLGEAIKSLLPNVSKLPTLRRIVPYVCDWGTPRLRRMIVERFPNERVQAVVKAVDQIDAKCWEIFRLRKKSLEAGEKSTMHEIAEGKDILSVLLKENMNAAATDKLPDNEVVAQMGTMVFAAMDTTSNALARVLHLLAEHPDIQRKLRQELIEASQGADMSYDDLVRLPYLDAICRETLRLFPPAWLIFRETRKDAIIPLSEPIRKTDGSIVTEVPVPKGTVIQIGIHGSNWNKALWGDDAMEWKPERWLAPLPTPLDDAKIPGVYSHLMTFLGGGRSCIGFKFSQLEIKAALAVLLPMFTFEPPEEPIIWNIGAVAYPTMSKEAAKPQMMLKVGLVENINV